MIQYKGYYIDHVYFNNKKEIDDFIKSELIRKYKMLCEMFADDPCMELVVMMEPYENRLHNEYGLSYEEIENIQIQGAA